MAKQPTQRQIDAYRFVYIHDCTFAQAAKLMGYKNKNAVASLIKRLKKTHPALFTSKRANYIIFSLNEQLDSEPVRKF